jgi:hypothetical protein
MSTKQELTRQEKTQPKARRTTRPRGVAEDSNTPLVSVCDDLQVRIAARAHELYVKRGCGDGYALDDWVQAEREVLSQVPPV